MSPEIITPEKCIEFTESEMGSELDMNERKNLESLIRFQGPEEIYGYIKEISQQAKKEDTDLGTFLNKKETSLPEFIEGILEWTLEYPI